MCLDLLFIYWIVKIHLIRIFFIRLICFTKIPLFIVSNFIISKLEKNRSNIILVSLTITFEIIGLICQYYK